MIKKGNLLSFGSVSMTDKNKKLYLVGYAFMFMGVVLTLFLFAIPR